MKVSRRYSYVEDYREVPTIGPNGKARRELLYIGEWVCPLLSQQEYRAFLLRTRIFCALAAAGLLLSLLVSHSAYETMYVAVPMVLALFPAAYLMMGAVSLKKGPEPLEKLHYKKGLARVRRSAMGLACTASLGLLGKAVFRALCIAGAYTGFGFTLADGLFLLGAGLAAAISFVLFFAARRVKTELRPNGAHQAKPR